MKRPMLFMLAFEIFGIFCGRYFEKGIVLFFLASVTAAGVLFFFFRSKLILLCPLLTLAGLLLTNNSLSSPNSYLEATAAGGDNVRVSGRVYDLSVSARGNTTAFIRTYEMDRGGEIRRVETNLVVTIPKGGKALELGQAVEMEGRLFYLSRPKNPGAFDEFIFYRARKISYRFSPQDYRTGDIFLTPSLYLRLFGWKMCQVFDSSLGERYGGIMKAMIIGDKSGLMEDVVELYQKAGVYHILAISGLHVLALSMFLRKWLKKAGVGKRTTGVIVMVFMAFYCIMTGCGVATVRAVMMGFVYTVGDMLHRDSDSPSAMGFAAALMLLYEPLFLWDLGFLFSFVLVAAIMAGTPGFTRLFIKISGRFPRMGRILRTAYLKKYLGGSVAGFVATSPLTAYFYYHISIASFFVNLMIAPAALLVVALGFLMGVVGILLPLGAKILGFGVTGLLFVNDLICKGAVSLPFSVVGTGKPEVLVVTFYFLLLAGLLAWLNSTGKEAKRYKALLPAGLICLMGSQTVFALLPQSVKAVSLYVGQGDSAVISHGKTAFVIDGGGWSNMPLEDNTGSRYIMPYLDYLGVSRLEAAFVSHADADHALGIIELIQENRVRSLVLGEGAEKGEWFDRLMEEAEKRNMEIKTLSPGDTVFIGGIGIECIHPPKEYGRDVNNSSMILRVEYGGGRILYTGDVEAQGEMDAIASYGDISADVLKVAHHGSGTSSTERFLDEVNPRAAIISAGENNMYGHPSPEVIERLDNRGIPWFLTARDGAVIVTMGWEKGRMNIVSMGDLYERDKR